MTTTLSIQPSQNTIELHLTPAGERARLRRHLRRTRGPEWCQPDRGPTRSA